MRGEHLHGANVGISSVGSSPHARGARGRRCRRIRPCRIIPACAGSTPSPSSSGSSWRDHPRMRGEHSTGCGDPVQARGSSPHARGALLGVDGLGAARGIIPACAGSTSRRRWPRRCSGDHPRMRGEHAQGPGGHLRVGDHPRMRGEHRLAATASTAPSGSSPHARGALVCVLTSGFPRRIIPACAGSTRR